MIQVCRDWPKWFREYVTRVNDGRSERDAKPRGQVRRRLSRNGTMAGPTAELPRKTDGRRIFTVEFKRGVVQQLLKGEQTLTEVSRELDIQPSATGLLRSTAGGGASNSSSTTPAPKTPRYGRSSRTPTACSRKSGARTLSFIDKHQQIATRFPDPSQAGRRQSKLILANMPGARVPRQIPVASQSRLAGIVDDKEIPFCPQDGSALAQHQRHAAS